VRRRYRTARPRKAAASATGTAAWLRYCSPAVQASQGESLTATGKALLPPNWRLATQSEEIRTIERLSELNPAQARGGVRWTSRYPSSEFARTGRARMAKAPRRKALRAPPATVPTASARAEKVRVRGTTSSSQGPRKGAGENEGPAAVAATPAATASGNAESGSRIVCRAAHRRSRYPELDISAKATVDHAPSSCSRVMPSREIRKASTAVSAGSTSRVVAA
jgi:hypothetical protein